MSTERDYVRDLKAIIGGYICKMSPIVPRDDLSVIFGNIEELYGVHVKFLKSVSDSKGRANVTVCRRGMRV